MSPSRWQFKGQGDGGYLTTWMLEIVQPGGHLMAWKVFKSQLTPQDTTWMASTCPEKPVPDPCEGHIEDFVESITIHCQVEPVNISFFANNTLQDQVSQSVYHSASGCNIIAYNQYVANVQVRFLLPFTSMLPPTSQMNWKSDPHIQWMMLIFFATTD